MVRLNYLDPFTTYSVKPPTIMPETDGNRKKGQAYFVLSPSIEDELRFLSTTKTIAFRYLISYFIEKRWDVKLYGQGKRTIKLNEDGNISALLTKYQSGNLKAIPSVTSFLSTYKGDLLKNNNVLVEVNHVIETILGNEKDRRVVRLKSVEIISELKRAMDIGYLGNYQKTTIIPMSLWFTPDDYANPATVFKLANRNLMGHILTALCQEETLRAFGKVALVDGVHLLILDADAIPEEVKTDVPGFIQDQIVRFMRKAKNRNNSPDNDRTYTAEVEEDDATSMEASAKVSAAEKKTKTDLTAEKALEAIKADPDKVPKEQREKVAKIVSAAEEKSSEPADETDDVERVGDNVSNLNISSQDADTMLAAKMAGRSAASEKRNELLREKYKDMKVGTTKMSDIIAVEFDIEIPEVDVKAHTINPALKELSTQRFEEAYDTKLAQHDLVSILMHFSTAHPAMYLNKDIAIEDVSTRTDRVLRYTVSFEDEDRKRHRFSFKLPKMYKHRYLFLNGQELNITHQKLPYPITKVQADRCQLVTNYNKIFVYRYGAALSPRINRLKKILSVENRNVLVRKGDCTRLNRSVLTTIEYDDLASMFVKIQIGNSGSNISFYFEPDGPTAVFNMQTKPTKVMNLAGETIEDKTLLPLALKKKGSTRTQYWLSGTSNTVYDDKGTAYGELSDFLVKELIEYVPNMEKELADTSAGTKFMYSRVRIMSQDIPLILVMGASDPDGLIGALSKGNIKYSFVEKRPTVDKNLVGVIPFADGYFVFDRYPYENSLLLNGLNTFPTKEYNFYDLNTRDAYVDIFDTMCGQGTLADNLISFYYMMIDPITKDVLKRLDMPTDFITLLYFCNGVLADNSFQIDSNYENSRIRSNEIIMAHLYRELAVAWSNYRSGRTDTFSIPEDVVIKLLLTSKIVDPKSKLNISLELENDRNVKLKGPSGMNEDHSFTIEKRAFHPTMRGIVATNSTPSGEVGINRHLVTNAAIKDARGFISVANDGKTYDGTELLSPGEMLQPFGPESADIERLCMSISQAKHLVPVASQCSSPISYDMERVAPYLSNDFAFVAKKDGKVVEINEDLLIVQYADGTYDDIDLSEHPAKNTDGGFYIMNKMESRYKVGNRFKAGDIIAYDPKTFNNNDFFGDPCANVGTLARVAFESNGSVFEDSGYITDSFAHRFATRITKQKRVILSKFANIKYIAKIGQSVQANDPILAFDDTEDEFSSQLLASITDQMEDQGEIIATTAPVVSKYTGVIRDIQIIYTVPPEEMSPSLRKVVENYAKDASKREKVLSKYMDVRDSNTILKSSEMSIPDSRGKVAGTRIDEGVIIDFYIEYEDVAGNGDKGSITALKFTVCNVVPTELAGYTDFNPDRKIEVYVASFGAFKRMVADVEKIGILTKVLVESKRLMKEEYGEKVKAELKRLRGRK